MDGYDNGPIQSRALSDAAIEQLQRFNQLTEDLEHLHRVINSMNDLAERERVNYQNIGGGFDTGGAWAGEQCDLFCHGYEQDYWQTYGSYVAGIERTIAEIEALYRRKEAEKSELMHSLTMPVFKRLNHFE